MQTSRRQAIAIALASAAAPAWGQPRPAFLDQLVADSTAPLTPEDYAAAAQTLGGASVQAVQAAVEVESARDGGFASGGRPRILFERHLFSRLTNREFDTTHPTLSQPAWTNDYPRTAEARWDQLRQAYALNADAALSATSWGLFQMLGSNFRDAGYPDVHAFVRDMSRSHAKQLSSWAQWVVATGIADELQARDWEGFARRYNGPANAASYAQRMAAAYTRLTGPTAQ